MKTKLTLLLAAMLSVPAFAGPSDSVALAQVHGNQTPQGRPAPATSDSNAPVKWVLVPNGKGGFTTQAQRDDAPASIALSKSAKSNACSSAACCSKH